MGLATSAPPHTPSPIFCFCRQGLWQVLPLGPLGYGNSPYSATSAFAGNPLLISLDRLAERGWIDRSAPARTSERGGAVEYEKSSPVSSRWW